MTEPAGSVASLNVAADEHATVSPSGSVDHAPGGRPFVDRHLGPDDAAIAHMLDTVGVDSLDELMAKALPAALKETTSAHDALPAALRQPLDEQAVLATLADMIADTSANHSMIGLGYYGTVIPPVVRRNVLESPAWYTAYTPYQPEISQGRLEALLNFQTAVADLTGLDVVNASLLDEATAVAEAATLMHRSTRNRSDRLVVDADILPQTLSVLTTRCSALGIDVEVVDLDEGLGDGDLFGVIIQTPGASGRVRDAAQTKDLIDQAHQRDAMVAVAADLLALALIASPGDLGADVAVGTTQRFGVPMGFGGPHAGYIAVRQGLERNLPGRLVGVSVDADGHLAYRLALQTREQHIRRERATSNICTAQVLLAVIAGMYAVWHGPDGLTAIARRVHGMATSLAGRLSNLGVEMVHRHFFDTVTVRCEGQADRIADAAEAAGVNLGRIDADHLRIACDETTRGDHLDTVVAAFATTLGRDADTSTTAADSALPSDAVRTSEFLTHAVFHEHRSESAMLRYLRRLSDKDYALDRGMIPLGSCTMKLNATTELEPITWPQIADVHPFVPANQTNGYRQMVSELETWLAALTGYAAVSVQPNAGSQGELAGLLAIAAYHRARGDHERDVCLIPSSAHGTNAASAAMAGMRVAVVASTEEGTIDVDDLKAKLAEHAGRVSAIMITYPSTHGVYEATIGEVCGLIHDAGGQVYIDGANLNALVGVAEPGKFGGDVSHLNLHKTFCIPHGGGGPGVGPVAVAEHLVPFLPGHPAHPDPQRRDTDVGPVSAAPFGSAAILPISWTYIRMMGIDGLTRATQVAVLSANYVAARLDGAFPVLYRGEGGLVAHECIVDVRPLARATGIDAEDVAKRLIDYGFHAPTLSFPVAGTLMIEPTESEDLAELDRFCDAMLAIRAEIDRVAAGEWPADDNPLVNAPHTAAMLVEEWSHPYDRATAVYPSPATRRAKYWPPVRRIDGAHGDRNLVCACPPPEAFAFDASPVTDEELS